MTDTAATTADFSPEFRRHEDAEGRSFEFAVVRHPGSAGLVVHFSAFFDPSKRPVYDWYRGYFHRLRMLGSSPAHDWLFVCDVHGAYGNGCYYLGRAGDLFVERATLAIVDAVMAEGGHGPDDVVTIGSSMGATGALSIGLQRGVRGVVAISPHVALDIAATQCNRYDEVAFACPDGDPTSAASHAVTHRIDGLLDALAPGQSPPRLFVQTAQDDAGVYAEQVLPFVASWRAQRGAVDLDVRPTGGHTSDHATQTLLLDAVGSLLRGAPIDVDGYRTDPRFAGAPTRLSLSRRVRSTLKVRTRYRAARRALRRAVRIVRGRAPDQPSPS